MKINRRRVFLALFDVLCFAFVAAFCFFVSVACFQNVTVADGGDYAISAALLCGFLFVSRILFGVYATLWRYTSSQAYFRIILADIVGCLLTIIVTEFLWYDNTFWVFITVSSLYTISSLFSRLGYRLLYKRSNGTTGRHGINIAIVGAGQLGAFLAREEKNFQLA